ncbi:MAG: DUF2513 domain-containing protein [Pirellulaceae bacterium]|nr:DUF2513 domain-containing protein [Pirellulaceae bacterium]
MKRDMELIRKILINLETRDGAEAIQQEYAPEQIQHHNWLILNAGLAEGTEMTSSDNIDPVAHLFALNWAGQEFLDMARDEGRWKQAKDKAKELGGAVSFAGFKAILTVLMEQAIKHVMGP